MKHLRETFTDQEWKRLKAGKVQSKQNWHDYLLIEKTPLILHFPDCEQLKVLEIADMVMKRLNELKLNNVQ